MRRNGRNKYTETKIMTWLARTRTKTLRQTKIYTKSRLYSYRQKDQVAFDEYKDDIRTFGICR